MGQLVQWQIHHLGGTQRQYRGRVTHHQGETLMGCAASWQICMAGSPLHPSLRPTLSDDHPLWASKSAKSSPAEARVEDEQVPPCDPPLLPPTHPPTSVLRRCGCASPPLPALLLLKSPACARLRM